LNTHSKKYIIYKIHSATTKIKHGGFCAYIDLDRKTGLKMYGTKKFALDSIRAQRKLLRVKVAPKVYSGVFEVPLLNVSWKGSHIDNIYKLKAYCYITEKAHTKFDRKIYRPQIKRIRNVLERYGLREDDILRWNNNNPIWRNLGVVRNKLVIIDFDPCTIYGYSN